MPSSATTVQQGINFNKVAIVIATTAIFIALVILMSLVAVHAFAVNWSIGVKVTLIIVSLYFAVVAGSIPVIAAKSHMYENREHNGEDVKLFFKRVFLVAFSFLLVFALFGGCALGSGGLSTPLMPSLAENNSAPSSEENILAPVEN